MDNQGLRRLLFTFRSSEPSASGAGAGMAGGGASAGMAGSGAKASAPAVPTFATPTRHGVHTTGVTDRKNSAARAATAAQTTPDYFFLPHKNDLSLYLKESADFFQLVIIEYKPDGTTLRKALSDL